MTSTQLDLNSEQTIEGTGFSSPIRGVEPIRPDLRIQGELQNQRSNDFQALMMNYHKTITLPVLGLILAILGIVVSIALREARSVPVSSTEMKNLTDKIDSNSKLVFAIAAADCEKRTIESIRSVTVSSNNEEIRRDFEEIRKNLGYIIEVNSEDGLESRWASSLLPSVKALSDICSWSSPTSQQIRDTLEALGEYQGRQGSVCAELTHKATRGFCYFKLGRCFEKSSGDNSGKSSRESKRCYQEAARLFEEVKYDARKYGLGLPHRMLASIKMKAAIENVEKDDIFRAIKCFQDAIGHLNRMRIAENATPISRYLYHNNHAYFMTYALHWYATGKIGADDLLQCLAVPCQDVDGVLQLVSSELQLAFENALGKEAIHKTIAEFQSVRAACLRIKNGEHAFIELERAADSYVKWARVGAIDTLEGARSEYGDNELLFELRASKSHDAKVKQALSDLFKSK